MSQYAESIRRFVAPYIFNDELSDAGGDKNEIVITPANWKIRPFRILTPSSDKMILPETNIIIRNMGLYCNIADGLLFDTVYEWPSLRIDVNVYATERVLTGALTTVAGSANITGVGTAFTTEIAPAGPDINRIVVVGGYPYRVIAISSDTIMNIDGAIPYTNSSGDSEARLLSVQGGGTVTLPMITTLNEMYPVNSFINIQEFGGSDITDIVLLSNLKSSLDPMSNTGMHFQTLSIADAFFNTNTWCNMHHHVDVEFTVGETGL